MKDLGQLMKRAQEMQAKMADMQKELAAVEVVGQAGGGMVQVTLNGKGDAKNIKVDRTLVDPKEVEMLEDLIVAAFNDARAKVEAHVAEKMRELNGGLDLPPGMQLTP